MSCCESVPFHGDENRANSGAACPPHVYQGRDEIQKGADVFGKESTGEVAGLRLSNEARAGMRRADASPAPGVASARGYLRPHGLSMAVRSRCRYEQRRRFNTRTERRAA